MTLAETPGDLTSCSGAFRWESVPVGDAGSMNPNEPRNPDQHPDNAETTRLPDTPPHTEQDHQHTVPLEGATGPETPQGGEAHATYTTPPAAGSPATAESDRGERRRKMRPLVIGAGAAAAILLLGGGGIAIGAAIADNGDDDQVSLTNSESSAPGVQSDDSAQSGSDDDDNDGDNGDDNGTSGASDSGAAAPAEAGDLTDAIEAAIAEANGEGATAIEVERDGYDVDVQLADGTEQEVRVALDGTATVRDGDSDTDDDPLLDTAKLGDIIDAALAEAGGGTIESISTDNGPAAYEVSVDMGNGDDTDVDLDANLAVLNVDRD